MDGQPPGSLESSSVPDPGFSIMNSVHAELDLAEYVRALGSRGRSAARALARVPGHRRVAALLAIADDLNASRQALQEANAGDLEAGGANGLDAAMLDRLRLDDVAIDRMIEGVRQVAALPDPVGEITDLRARPSGIQVGQMRVPIGVIGIIYESRPNVTVDAASLCLKSGNATILRGG